MVWAKGMGWVVFRVTRAEGAKGNNALRRMQHNGTHTPTWDDAASFSRTRCVDRRPPTTQYTGRKEKEREERNGNGTPTAAHSRVYGKDHQAHGKAQGAGSARHRGAKSTENAHGMGGAGAGICGERGRAHRCMQQAHKEDGSTQKEARLLTQVLRVGAAVAGKRKGWCDAAVVQNMRERYGR